MKSSDIFPSKYLRAADLNGAEPIVQIDRIEMQTIGNETKPIMYFRGKDKGIVLNKTNWASVEDITGEDDCDNWAGTKIKLITAKVMFEGKLVPAIRIEPVKTGRVALPPKKATPPPSDDADDIPVSDDDITF